MSNTANQAIIRKSYTESLTFTGVPSEQLRKELQAKGFKFKNGQWYRNSADSAVIAESEVAQRIAA